jgi:hypothetical protein
MFIELDMFSLSEYIKCSILAYDFPYTFKNGFVNYLRRGFVFNHDKNSNNQERQLQKAYL